MAITSFVFDHAHAEKFVAFPYQLYRSDKHWLPSRRQDVYAQLSETFPFYQKAGNRHRHFLAMKDKKMLGRASAFINRELKNDKGEPVATIGFFECVPDKAVARDLLDASLSWLLADELVSEIWGPMNFDIWHGYRFMTKGFGRSIFPGEPYQKDYYPEMFQEYGFIPRQRWFSLEYNAISSLNCLCDLWLQRYHELVGQGYYFAHIQLDHFREELSRWYQLLLPSFRNFLGFTPISEAEFAAIFLPYRPLFHSQLFTMVSDESRQLAGYGCAFPDVGDALRALKGRRDIYHLLKFRRQMRKAERVLLYFGGITPAEMRKKSGLGHAIFSYIIGQIITAGFSGMTLALVAEGSRALRLLGNQAADFQREYQLYEFSRRTK